MWQLNTAPLAQKHMFLSTTLYTQTRTHTHSDRDQHLCPTSLHINHLSVFPLALFGPLQSLSSPLLLSLLFLLFSSCISFSLFLSLCRFLSAVTLLLCSLIDIFLLFTPLVYHSLLSLSVSGCWNLVATFTCTLNTHTTQNVQGFETHFNLKFCLSKMNAPTPFTPAWGTFPLNYSTQICEETTDPFNEYPCRFITIITSKAETKGVPKMCWQEVKCLKMCSLSFKMERRQRGRMKGESKLEGNRGRGG